MNILKKLKNEIDSFEQTFKNAVRESASVIQIKTADDLSETNKKLDYLLDKEKKLPRRLLMPWQ